MENGLLYASSCAIPNTFVPLALVNRFPVNHDTHIFEFAVPEGSESLNLPVCACLLLCVPGREHESKGGGDAVRPYTPVSPNEMKGVRNNIIKMMKLTKHAHCDHR